VAGSLIAWETEARFGKSGALGIPGTVILISVAAFVVSAVVGPRLRRSVRSAPAS
jgi:hypothetical protein